MTEQTYIMSNEGSFKDFLFKNKRNRITLLLAAISIVVQFGIFKYFYPFASYIHGDSFVYLDTAYRNLSINSYMVGYSNFLRLISVFTTSDIALVALQYILIQGSALFLLFTLFYFYKPQQTTQIVLLVFMLLNPLFLHLANMVSSDGYFLTLSFIWFTSLLWIIYQPSAFVIILHALILYLAFTVRYNALIYPLLSIFVICIAKISFKIKMVGIASSALLCGLFVIYTSYKFQKLTGHWQYSPFSGWQLANNALYAYRYLDNADRKPVPQRFKVLDNMIRNYFDTTRNTANHPEETWLASTVYMWDLKSPLYKYRNLQFPKDSIASELKKWASMGPLYADYGTYLIKKYPLFYIRYFLWPNSNKFFAPPVEFLEQYNSGRDSVAVIAQAWFKYKTQKVKTRMSDSRITILNFYPILSGIINLVMVTCLILFTILNGFKKNTKFKKGILLATILWITNAGFTILASSVALRFQAFPILLVFTFDILLINWLLEKTREIDSRLSNEVIKLKPEIH